MFESTRFYLVRLHRLFSQSFALLSCCHLYGKSVARLLAGLWIVKLITRAVSGSNSIVSCNFAPRCSLYAISPAMPVDSPLAMYCLPVYRQVNSPLLGESKGNNLQKGLGIASETICSPRLAISLGYLPSLLISFCYLRLMC